MVIQYCDSCGMRVSDDDLQGGTALQGEENKVWCARCAPAQFVQTDSRRGRSSKILKAVTRDSQRRIKPITGESNKVNTPAQGVTTTPQASAPRPNAVTSSSTSHSQSARSTTGAPPKSNTIVIAAVMTAVVLLGALVLASGGSSPSKPLEGRGNRTDAVVRNDPPEKPRVVNDNPPAMVDHSGISSSRNTDPGKSSDSPPAPQERASPVSAETVKNVDNELSEMRNGIANKRLEDLKAFIAANPDDFFGLREKASDLLITYRSTPAGEEAVKIMAAIKAPAGAATYVRTDSTTSGTWRGVYGKDGYVLAGDDRRKLPAGFKFPITTNRTVTWKTPSNDDLRSLQRPTSDNRFCICWANPTYYFDLQTDDKGSRVSLYFLDWDKQKRVQTVDILDASDAVLDKRDVADFGGGLHVVYDIKGTVRIRITKRGPGTSAVMCGIFFDPIGVDAPVGLVTVQAPAPPVGTPDKPIPPDVAAKNNEEALFEYERAVSASYVPLKTGDMQGAIAALEKAKADPRLAPLLPKLAIDIDFVQFIDDINKAGLAMLPGLAEKGPLVLEKIDGEKIRVGANTKSKITEIKDRVIQIEQNVGGGKVSIGVEFDALSLATRLELAGSAVSELKSAYGWYVAMQLGATQFTAKALRQRVDAARKADANAAQVEHLSGRIAMFEKEQAAEPAFRNLDPLIKDKKWAEAQTFLEAYVKDYAGTKALQRVKPVIDQRLSEIDAILHPPKPGLWTSYWISDGKAGTGKTMYTAHAENTTTFAYGNSAPDPAVPVDGFAVKMSGLLRIDKDGTYGFKLSADDRISLTVDGKEAAATASANKDKYVDLALTRGDHAIKIVFVDISGNASFSLTWKLPGAKTYSAIPGSILFYDERNVEKYQKE